MSITINKTFYNNVVYVSIVLFIISIYPWGISTRCYHGYYEFFNKNISNICWVFQGAILSNPHMSAWMVFALWCC